MKKEELINSKEYYLTKLQLDLYNLAINYIKNNNLTQEDLDSPKGIFAVKLKLNKSEIKDLLSGDIDCNMSKFIDILLFFNKIPNLEFNRNTLLANLKLFNVSKEVQYMASFIINELNDEFISNFNTDDMYESSYGTIVLEFIKNNSSFTIEIGKNTFGYFVDKNENSNIMIEEIIINNESINKLNSDFLSFIL